MLTLTEVTQNENLHPKSRLLFQCCCSLTKTSISDRTQVMLNEYSLSEVRVLEATLYYQVILSY